MRRMREIGEAGSCRKLKKAGAIISLFINYSCNFLWLQCIYLHNKAVVVTVRYNVAQYMNEWWLGQRENVEELFHFLAML
jgi:hypothetical protein